VKRIVIVDDELCVLSGLRRQLHARRGEWELLYADGGERALEALAAGPADVLVTDVRMPGMDGAQLLLRAAAAHPRLARLVLSGQAEPERQLAARISSHRYLVKPCPAEPLEAAIRAALEVRAVLDGCAWPEADRLWRTGPGHDAFTATLSRLLILESDAEETRAALGSLFEADPQLRDRATLALGGRDDPRAAWPSAPQLRALAALALALRLHELVAGPAACGAATARAGRAAEAARGRGQPPEAVFQAATTALLDLPGPPLPPERRRAVLDFLLPVWGLPEPGAAPPSGPGATPDAPAHAPPGAHAAAPPAGGAPAPRRPPAPAHLTPRGSR
jgi:CheY-like chemotaxis protein